MNEDLISIVQIAEELNQNKAFIFKLVDRFGIEKTMQKSSLSRGQKIAYISHDDFSKIKEYVQVKTNLDNKPEEVSASGVFYLIQLEPEHDSGRFKLGFASNLEERLRAHKTAAPFSKVLNSWPCKLLWEKTAIESVTQGCERLHTEVFRSTSLQEVEERCDAFFSIMPNLISNLESSNET